MKQINLTSTCNITTGKLDANAAVVNGKYPYFTCANEPLQINEYAFDEKAILLAGNNASGNFHCQRYDGKFNAYQRTYVITAKEGYDIDYIYYSILISLEQLKKKSQGSQTKFITMEILDNFYINDIELCEQKRMVLPLLSLDNKIKLNRKINDNLEQQAQMLYEHWFIQFDFPDKCGKPYKKSGNQMVYNHTLKMDIPMEWSVGTLSDIANITMGQSPEGESYNVIGNGIEFFQGSTDFGAFFPTTRVYTTKPKRMSKENDILLSVRAPVGTMNIAYQDCCIGRGLASIQGKTNNTAFVRHLLKSNKYFFDRINNAGTTFGAITKDILYEMPVIVPPTKVMIEYENLVAKSEATIRSAENEIRQLTHIREYLLPLLLNGQLNIDI